MLRKNEAQKWLSDDRQNSVLKKEDLEELKRNGAGDRESRLEYLPGDRPA